MKKSKLSARSLKAIIVIALILTIGVSAVGFYFAQYFLGNISSDISNTVATSNASSNDLQALKKLEDNLASRQEVISKTNILLSSPETYQGQAIKDLTKYANDVGITISDYSFGQAAATKTTSKTKTAEPQTTVTLSVVSPISYSAFLKFITLIEGNLPKMQISSVELGRISGNPESIKVDKLIVEVYTN